MKVFSVLFAVLAVSVSGICGQYFDEYTGQYYDDWNDLDDDQVSVLFS